MVRTGIGGPPALVVVMTAPLVVARVGIGGPAERVVVPGGGRVPGGGLAVVVGGGRGDGTTGLFVVTVATSQYCPFSKKYSPSSHLPGKASPPEHQKNRRRSVGSATKSWKGEIKILYCFGLRSK